MCHGERLFVRGVKRLVGGRRQYVGAGGACRYEEALKARQDSSVAIGGAYAPWKGCRAFSALCFIWGDDGT